jgi:WD40 repeat protein
MVSFPRDKFMAKHGRLVAFTSDGLRLAAAVGAVVQIIFVREQKLQHRLEMRGSDVWTVSMTGDGSLVAAGDEGGTVSVWRGSDGRALWSGQLCDGIVAGSAFASGSSMLAVAGGPIRVVDLARKQWLTGAIRPDVRTLDGPTGRCVAFSGDGRLIAAGSQSGKVAIWSTSDWRLSRDLQSDSGIQDLAFSPDGTFLVAANMSGGVDIWKGPTWTLYLRMDGHDGACNSVAVTGNGKYLLSCGDDGYYLVRRLSDGAMIHSEREDDDRLLSVAVTRDGGTIALRDDSGNLRRFDTRGALA